MNEKKFKKQVNRYTDEIRNKLNVSYAIITTNKRNFSDYHTCYYIKC